MIILVHFHYKNKQYMNYSYNFMFVILFLYYYQLLYYFIPYSIEVKAKEKKYIKDINFMKKLLTFSINS
jgi:hypothetical protein